MQDVSIVPYSSPPQLTLRDIINPGVGDKLYETSNQFEQDWLVGSKQLHVENLDQIVMDNSTIYQKKIRSEAPKQPEEWFCPPAAGDGDVVSTKASEENHNKGKMKFHKGMRRWTALPELVEVFNLKSN